MKAAFGLVSKIIKNYCLRVRVLNGRKSIFFRSDFQQITLIHSGCWQIPKPRNFERTKIPYPKNHKNLKIV